MAFSFQDMVEEARLSARALIDFGEHFFNPTVRLGVTGLSRAGKTVFITALIHGLTRGGRFPVFEAYASGRIARAHLAPQPDDAVPRFAYENHLRALIEERRWPNSTVDISELRLVIDYQRQNGADRTLTLDIVDYPGEWLLDLPLLQKSYEQWSAESLALSREAPRAHLAADWHAHLATLKPEAREDEQATLTAAKLFTGHLRACRDERFAMSLLPPGRFLMPGNLADTPALTFAPLDVPVGGQAPDGSLWAMMVRRFEAYKNVVVRPFFHDHFARLDRQIVLADALAGILDCFRIGRSTFLSSLFRPRIDRILFAATKADHLHHSSHDRLEAVLRRAVTRAVVRAEDTGAEIDVVALAAVRATREAQVAHGRDKLPSILGTPAAGESAGGEFFDGNTEVATFPGDLPPDPEPLFNGTDAFRGLSTEAAEKSDFRFLRFRPPKLEREGNDEPALPHIRLDRALQFLIGDKLS
ncbi:YcjX family protein [Bradyrhizobium japonicum]|uniref:YcjX family protein n=1 Tax=Bradyrhizobium japonicum TaxID=375 RepID=UPI0013706AD5|nr:YcjX family protein [Bradyrhizobium japonicum]MYV87708.1 YcjX family protein [Bradyrhizobium japonicum]